MRPTTDPAPATSSTSTPTGPRPPAGGRRRASGGPSALHPDARGDKDVVDAARRVLDAYGVAGAFAAQGPRVHVAIVERGELRGSRLGVQVPDDESGVPRPPRCAQ